MVHRRGPDGPNTLVPELKKTTDPEHPDIRDRERVQAFLAQLRYSFGRSLSAKRVGRRCQAAPLRLPQFGRAAFSPLPAARDTEYCRADFDLRAAYCEKRGSLVLP